MDKRMNARLERTHDFTSKRIGQEPARMLRGEQLPNATDDKNQRISIAEHEEQTKADKRRSSAITMINKLLKRALGKESRSTTPRIARRAVDNKLQKAAHNTVDNAKRQRAAPTISPFVNLKTKADQISKLKKKVARLEHEMSRQQHRQTAPPVTLPNSE